MYSNTYKRYITFLLFTAYVFNQIDRAIFGFLMEPIRQEFGVSDTQLGFLAGPAFVILYASLGIPISRWADRSHRVSIMSCAVLLWSLVVMLTATVQRFWQLALVRVGVGIGEAGFSAIAMSVVGDYYNDGAGRTRALSRFMLAIPLGAAFSSLLAGWINERYGWRAVFVIAGLPGILVALLVRCTVDEPVRRAGLLPNASDTAWPPLRSVLATIWQSRSLRHLAIAQGLANVVLVAMAWAPTFFIRVHNVSTGELGTWFAVIGVVGGIAGIWLSGRLTSRYESHAAYMKIRLMAGVTALVVPAALVVLWFPSKEMALLALLVAQVPLVFFLVPTYSIVQDLSAGVARSTITSVFVLIQMIAGGVFGTQLVGSLSDALRPFAGDGGSALQWSMTLISPIALWAAWHFWIAGRSMERELGTGRDGKTFSSAGNANPLFGPP